MKLKEIADIISGYIIGDPEADITEVSGIEDAKKGSITFVADKRTLGYVHNTNASAIIVKQKIKDAPASILIVDNPYLAFAKTLELFHKTPLHPFGISEEAFIGKDINFGNDVSVYPGAHICNHITVGNRVTLYPRVYIGDSVTIGDDSIIYPNTTIRENVKIGKQVVVHSGTVIGSDGFGYVQEKGKHYKIPQVGGVVIGDEVEIGANVTIDRATIGNTIIESGTKIDNLVHIAHNVKIGKDCIVLAQAGISGSVEIGDGVIIAGQVGIRDHIKIANGVIVVGKSGVAGNLERGVYSGMPAIPHKVWLRAQSIYTKLPDILKRIQELEKIIKGGRS